MKKIISKHKLKILLAVGLILIVTTSLMGQINIDDGVYETAPDNNVRNALQFTQGVKIYEDWFTAFF